MRISTATLLLPVLLLILVPPLKAAEFFRWIDPNGVVHFTDNLHSIPEARRATAVRIKGQQPPRPAEPSKVAPAIVAKASIPFEKHGQVVVVEVMLNKSVPAKLVVDTGATYTMISAATAKELSIDPERASRTMPFQTANGMIQAPLANLESVIIGGMEDEKSYRGDSRRGAKRPGRRSARSQLPEQLSSGYRYREGHTPFGKEIIIAHALSLSRALRIILRVVFPYLGYGSWLITRGSGFYHRPLVHAGI